MTVDWTALAPEWDRKRDEVEAMKAELTEGLLASLAPLEGRRVLELGAGTGELAARLAEIVGSDGSVLASDLAEGMVAVLRGRLAGLPNVETAQLDAADIALPTESVDVVVFRMGLMLLVDPEMALREIRRVLRPGGRVAIAVWGMPQDNPWMTSVGMAAMMHGLVQGGPPIGSGGPFSLADPDDLEKRVRGAGFETADVQVVSGTRHFADPGTHIEIVRALSPHLSAALSNASAEQLAAVQATVGELTAQLRAGDGLDLPSRSLLCVAG